LDLTPILDDNSWREKLQVVLGLTGDLGDARYPDCPGCNPWLWNVKPVTVTERYTVVRHNKLLGKYPDGRDKFGVIPGSYLFMPRTHAATLSELLLGASDWLEDAIERLGLADKHLARELYTGKEPGQTLPWPYILIVDRGVLTSHGSESLATILMKAMPPSRGSYPDILGERMP